MRFPLILIGLLIATSLAVGFAAGKTVYRVTDEPGIDQVIGTQPDPVLKGRIDILEAYLEVDGGTVEVYIMLNTSGFPSLEQVMNSYSYMVEAYLKSGDKVKDFEALLTINPGVALAACSLEDNGDKKETIGSFEFSGSNPLILKITCSFEGESFDVPSKNDMLFTVSATVGPSTIGDASASLIDNLVLGVDKGEVETPSTPNETGQEPVEPSEETEEEGGEFNILPVIVIVVIGLAGAALYVFMKMRG